MYELGAIKTFRIVVYEDGVIRVQQMPEEGAIPDCCITLDQLEEQTVNFLINILRNQQLREAKNWQLLGTHLYKVLLNNDIGRAIHMALYNQAFQLVRIELEFKPNRIWGNLASWPWEYLYCPLEYGHSGTGYFLTRKPRLLLVRHFSLDFPPPQQLPEPPLRVLFVAVNPDDCPPVMHAGVLETLQEIERELGSKKFRLYALVDEHKQLRTQTLENVPSCTTFHQLLEVVNYYQPHVIHIIAHGRYQSSEGQIALMGEDRKAHWIGDAKLSECLVNNNSLRLVFLQSCESALSNSYEAVSGCAKFLVNNGVSAVIAMQYEIQANAAVLFAKTFYEALKKSLPIDVAVQEARKKMSLAISDKEQSYAFGLPVLYLSQSQPLFVPKILTNHRRRNKHV